MHNPTTPPQLPYNRKKLVLVTGLHEGKKKKLLTMETTVSLSKDTMTCRLFDLLEFSKAEDQAILQTSV